MTTSASVQTKSRPAVVTFALSFLVAAFVIPTFRVGLTSDWQLGRVAVITIVILVLIWVLSIAFLRGWQLAWWILVLGILLDAAGVVLDLTAVGPGPLAQAQSGFARALMAVQYAFELVALVLLLHPKARSWFGVSKTAERSTRDVA